jgi:hypothetical protein
MRWYYYIPHVDEGKPRVWEDIYVMADRPEITESIWLTIDGYQPEDRIENGAVWAHKTEIDDENLAKLRSDGYIIDDTNLLIEKSEFSRSETIEWAKRWLELEGFEITEWIEGTFEQFSGTNEDIRNIEEAIRRWNEYKKQEGINDDE